MQPKMEPWQTRLEMQSVQFVLLHDVQTDSDELRDLPEATHAR